MNQQELLQRRLYYQQLSSPSFDSPGELVAWMGGVQAQDYPMSQWAIGLRLPQATEATIEAAAAAGNIIRTHVLRPTWHWVAAADIRWMLRLTAPRIHAYAASYYRKAELDQKVFKKSNSILEKILRDHNHLSRVAIAAALQKAKIDTNDLRLTHLLFYAELEGLICSGVRQEKQITYALLDERVPAVKPLNREESLAELALRYFQSHGPAGIPDFAWWCGLNRAEAKEAVELIRNKLTWIRSGAEELAYIDSGTTAPKPSGVLLLPNYDEYLVGYTNRELLMREDSKALSRDGNPIFSNTIVINGKVEGSWKRVLKPGSVQVNPAPFTLLSPAKQKQLQQAIDKYSRFVGK